MADTALMPDWDSPKREMTCGTCGDRFMADAATQREAHITGVYCPICWFKLMGSEFTCAPNYPADKPIAVQMNFTCDDCVAHGPDGCEDAD